MKRILLVSAVAALLSSGLIALAQTPGVNSTIPVMWNMVWEASTTKPTYSATGPITPASSATDICGITGSASKTIRVRRLILSGYAQSAQVVEPISVIKRSTASTGGGSAMTAIPYDSASAAASAVIDLWTTNPTVGTAVGMLVDRLFTIPLQNGSQPAAFAEFKFGELGSPVVLRGAAQSLNANLNNITINGTLTCTWEWTEE